MVVELEDIERQLLERDIHDGAQQQLVALAVQPSTRTKAAASWPRSPSLTQLVQKH
jgi:signal transduction histidine kinase